MSVIEYPRQSFDQMSRKQAITTCLALEDIRDRAVAEVERLRADVAKRDDALILYAIEITRLHAVLDVPSEPAPELEREDDAPSLDMDRSPQSVIDQMDRMNAARRAKP